MESGDAFLLYATLATAAATLIGLLFVALTFTAERVKSEQDRVGTSVQAAGCMLCFIDVLAISLFGLAEPTNIAVTAIILGMAGLLYALGSLRSILRVGAGWRQTVSQLGFILAFAALFVLQLRAGLTQAAKHPTAAQELHSFSTLLIVVLLVGVARTWQMVGLRDTGMMSSLLTIVRGDKHRP